MESCRTAGLPEPAGRIRPLSDAHTDQYRDFLDAIEQGRSPLVTVAEATRTLAVVCAIYESARTGKPVPVSWPADPMSASPS